MTFYSHEIKPTLCLSLFYIIITLTTGYVRFLLACIIKIVNLSYEVHPFWLCLFWFLSGGVRGPLSIAHVFVISVFRSFDGLPRCDKTTSSKSWPSSRMHQSGCSLHWQFAGFSIAPMRCLLFRLYALVPVFSHFLAGAGQGKNT